MNFRALLVATVLLGAATAQPQLTRVLPDTASPGDLVLVEGSNLAGASVTFRANVGGFVGTWLQTVALQPAGPGRWSVQLPTMAGFAPPNATPPGNPRGSVALSTGGPSLPFFFLQGSFHPKTGLNPQSTTLGTGTTQSGATGKPVVSLDHAGGAPVPGNAACVLLVQNVPPGTLAALLVGSAAKAPYVMLGDGTIVLDLGLPFLALPAVNAGGGGQASTPTPVPAAATGTALVAQWAVVDAGLPGVAVSNGLQFQL